MLSTENVLVFEIHKSHIPIHKKENVWLLCSPVVKNHLAVQGMQVQSLMGQISLCINKACKPQLERKPMSSTKEKPTLMKEPNTKRPHMPQLRPDAGKQIHFFLKQRKIWKKNE